METFSSRLINLREDHNITYNQLSKAIEVNKTTIYRWEKGSHEPRLLDIVKLAQFFAVTSDYLIGLEKEPCRNESRESA